MTDDNETVAYRPATAYRDDRHCPDGGRCSHLCPDGNGCWRVSFCSPFTSYGDDWTPEDRAANTNRQPTHRTDTHMITACYDRILARLARLFACDSRVHWDWAGNAFYDRWQRRLYERALREGASWTPQRPAQMP